MHSRVRMGQAWAVQTGLVLVGGRFLGAVDICQENRPTQTVPEGEEALCSPLVPLSPSEDPLLFCRKQTLFGLEAHLQRNLISIGLWLA